MTYTGQSKHNAKRLLCHYFRTMWEKSGLAWDGDNEVEVSGIVDDIIDAVEEVKP